MVQHDEGFFSAQDNLRLFWESDVPDTVRAHVGLVHGYGDHCGRHRKVIEFLVQERYAMHAFDYRGHGQADGRRGHCDAFTEYVDDLSLFWARLGKAAGDKKRFLIAHSFGAVMAIHFIAKRRPADLAGLILTAPWLKLNFTPPPLKVAAAKVIGKVIPWLPFGNELKPEQFTRDVEAQKLVERDPLFGRITTPRWFNEAMRAQLDAIALAPSIDLPLLVISGTDDPVSNLDTTRKFVETTKSADKTLTEYSGMRHEPMNELGKEEVWREISSWISKHL
jgi:lysophospholipase